MRKTLTNNWAALFGAAFFLCATAFADERQDSADRQLDEIMATYWDFVLTEDPLVATQAGINEFNDRLPSVTPDDQQRRLATELRFLARSRDLDRRALSVSGRINADIFEWVLEDSIAARQLNLSQIPFNTFSGFFMDALNAHNGVRMVSVEDFEDYLTRLADIPRYFDENLANMEEGSKRGFVLPRIVVDGVVPTIRAQVKEDPEDSSFYGPLAKIGGVVPPEEEIRLQNKGREIISDAVMPAFRRIADFLQNEYGASTTLGASQLPEGMDYYAFQVRRYTTMTDLTAEQIHQIGLSEVARIRSEMIAVINHLNFDGDVKAFAEFLRTDSRFYAKTAEELLMHAAYTAKRIDYLMPGFFGLLPRQTYGIVPVPEEVAPNYTTGAYYGVPLGADRGGAYWLNTYALDQRPLYELAALTLHEAVPGHHHQSAIAKEMKNVPEFRKDLYFSAFGEGWALYTEKLGVEMGVYRDPYEEFGRLSYEMWRACRLVIDTGIHSQGWSRRRAIEFLSEHTSLSDANVRAEVDRYISWPGQALAYKLGELRIWSLRKKAEETLGDRFDIREFHDAVLANGALPIATLDTVIEQYIDAALSTP